MRAALAVGNDCHLVKIVIGRFEPYLPYVGLCVDTYVLRFITDTSHRDICGKAAYGETEAAVVCRGRTIGRAVLLNGGIAHRVPLVVRDHTRQSAALPCFLIQGSDTYRIVAELIGKREIPDHALDGCQSIGTVKGNSQGVIEILQVVPIDNRVITGTINVIQDICQCLAPERDRERFSVRHLLCCYMTSTYRKEQQEKAGLQADRSL